MLLGTGIDLIEVERIAQSIERYADRFVRRVYTEREIAYCRARSAAAESFAARFAAKEAAAKALGSGIQLGAGWREIEVTKSQDGPPAVELSGRARDRAAELGVRRISLSLTHTRELAIAMVVMED